MDERLISLLEDILGIDGEEINEQTSADNVSQWDSLNHLKVITAIEEEFDIIFTMDEVESVENVGELQQLIDAKKDAA